MPAQTAVEDRSDHAHLYNDDLLLHQADRDYALREYPIVYHVLDDPIVRDLFRPVDDAANRAKRRSHDAGMAAIALALLSLATTTAEPVWHGLPVPWPRLLSLGSAVMSLTALCFAIFGLLYGKRKDEWLRNRLYAERLRQLHFQSFIWRLPEIAASVASEPGANNFREIRKQWIAGAAQRLRGSLDGELAAVLNRNQQAKPFMFDVDPAAPPPVPIGFDLEPLLKAYKMLRIDAQIAFANHKLSGGVWSFDPRRMSLRMQQRQFGFIWGSALALLALFHLFFIFDALGAGTAVDRPWLHVAATWLTLVALAVKSLQDGLGLRGEILRYEEYRAEVSDIAIRFDHTSDPSKKLALMIDMEEAAFREMRDFLRIHEESTFIL